jgi:hypothetical protein
MISSKRRCCGRSPMRGFGNRDRTFEAGSWPSCATSSSHRLRSQSARRRHLRCWASRTSDRRRTSARRDWRCAMPGRRSAVCRVSSSAILLVGIEDKSYAEVAERMGTSVGAVRLPSGARPRPPENSDARRRRPISPSRRPARVPLRITLFSVVRVS